MKGPRQIDVDVTVKIPGRRVACKVCGVDSHFYNKCPRRPNNRERQTRPFREQDRLEEARATLALNRSEDFLPKNKRQPQNQTEQKAAAEDSTSQHQPPTHQLQPTINQSRVEPQQTSTESHQPSSPNTSRRSYSEALRSPPKERNPHVASKSTEDDITFLKSIDVEAAESEVIEKNLRELRAKEAEQREALNKKRDRDTRNLNENKRTDENKTKDVVVQKNRFSLLYHVDEDGNLTSGTESYGSGSESEEEMEEIEVLPTGGFVRQTKHNTKEKRKRNRKERSSNEESKEEENKKTKVASDEDIEKPVSDVNHGPARSHHTETGGQTGKIYRPGLQCDVSTQHQTIDPTQSQTPVAATDTNKKKEKINLTQQQMEQLKSAVDGIPFERQSSAARSLLAALEEPEALSNTFSLDPHYIDDSIAGQHLGGEGHDSSSSVYHSLFLTPGTGGGENSMPDMPDGPKSFSTPLPKQTPYPSNPRSRSSSRHSFDSNETNAAGELKGNATTNTKFVKTKRKAHLSSRLTNAMTSFASKISPPKSADKAEKKKGTPHTRSGSARRKPNPSSKPAPQSKK